MGNLSTASENAGPSQTSGGEERQPASAVHVLYVVLETTGGVNVVGEFADAL
jgi:hypothetical protein